MASGVDSGSDSGSQDPYARLGITADSGFEAVQQAKAAALDAAGDDPQARAKVEAAYDAVLMARLRERQTGKLSVAAASASEREQQVSSQASASNNGPTVLTRLRQLSIPKPSASVGSWTPTLALVEGQGLLVRAVAGGFGLLLLVAASGSADLVLSLGTLGLFLSQIKRGRRPLASLGWSVLLLAVGLAVGALFVAVAGSALVPLFGADQLQALPALLVLLAGALLLA